MTEISILVAQVTCSCLHYYTFYMSVSKSVSNDILIFFTAQDG